MQGFYQTRVLLINCMDSKLYETNSILIIHVDHLDVSIATNNFFPSIDIHVPNIPRQN